VRKFTRWLVSVVRHWGSLVTGGVIIGILGVWQGTDHRVPPFAYWIVAILGLIAAFYKAWAAEHDAKVEARDSTRIQEETARISRDSEQRLKDEIARLNAIQFEPQFRFVPVQRIFGSETCDALEVWNDGAPVTLNDLRQASYIELSFTFEPSHPDDGAKFAASVDALLGAGFRYCAGSVLEERVNLNHLQELLRHPANPLGVLNNTEYVLSLKEELAAKYLVDLHEQFVMPWVKRLGIARKINPNPEAIKDIP